MVFVSLGLNLTFLFEPANAFATNSLEEEAEGGEGGRRGGRCVVMMLSSKLLWNHSKPDVFHMEMSECLGDSAHTCGGDENVDCGVIS